MKIYETATRYEVSVLPPDVIDRDLWTFVVEVRGEGRWAVMRRGHWCLGTDGEWDLEPIPSDRTDEWKATHRFDLETALRLAREHAPGMRSLGRTAADVLAEAGGGS